MTNEQLFTDREWGEAKMFGQYEQRENREEVVVFRRVDLASYVSMIRAYDASLMPPSAEQQPRPWIGLTLEEIENIIKSNITITDQRLYEGVYAVTMDIEIAIMNKNL